LVHDTPIINTTVVAKKAHVRWYEAPKGEDWARCRSKPVTRIVEGVQLALEVIGQVADVSSPSGYTLLNRTFRTPSTKLINLREWDMSVSGGAVYPLDPAERQEDVNGAPAQLTILQSPSGIAVSILTWIEGRREYQLMMDANVKAPGSPNLLGLARSLPKSVPGGQLDGSFKGFPATWDSK
jgi:hypothetical protein